MEVRNGLEALSSRYSTRYLQIAQNSGSRRGAVCGPELSRAEGGSGWHDASAGCPEALNPGAGRRQAADLACTVTAGWGAGWRNCAGVSYRRRPRRR
jgi:hypothetical protein